MFEGASGTEPEDVEPEDLEPQPEAAGARRQVVETAAVLLAVERVGADVNALNRALAAQPEEVAARLDVDSAIGAVGVRVGSLGSALDQLRLSLLANLDRLTAAVAAADPGVRLVRVEQAVAELADGVRAGAAVADALDHLGQRLAAIEDAAGRVAADARLLVERVAPVPDRLAAIAGQVDRITPLARAGDQAGSLFDHLERVGGDLQELIMLLRARGAGPEDDDRFEGVVDVLAGVSRRQDEVSAVIGSVVDQVRGPRGADAVFERMEQRERSLAARLDRIDAELRRRSGDVGPRSSGASEARADLQSAPALEGVVAALEQQERALTRRLDQIEARLQATGAADLARLVESTAERLDRRLARVESALEGSGPATGQARRPPASAEDTALRLARVRAERAQVQARLQEERLLAKTRRNET